MTRTPLIYSILIIIFSLFGLAASINGSILMTFLPSIGMAFAGLVLATLLISVYLLNEQRQQHFMLLIDLLGKGLFAAAIIGLISPTYFGEFKYFVTTGNISLLILAGASFSIASLEVPHRRLLQWGYYSFESMVMELRMFMVYLRLRFVTNAYRPRLNY